MNWLIVTYLASEALERLRKFCSRTERGFLGLGEALAKAHARSGLQLSRNDAKTQKDRFLIHPTRAATVFLKMLKRRPHRPVPFLLVVGFYLINIGYVALALKHGAAATNPQEALEA